MLFVWDFFVMAFSLNFYLNLDNRLKSNVRAIYCYIRQNYQTLSTLAVETLLNLVNEVDVPMIQQIPVELVVRGST